MTNAPKPIWKSRTMWLNGIVFVATVAVALLGIYQQANYQLNVGTGTAMLLAFLNALLRLNTAQPIAGTAAARAATGEDAPQ